MPKSYSIPAVLVIALLFFTQNLLAQFCPAPSFSDILNISQTSAEVIITTDFLAKLDAELVEEDEPFTGVPTHISIPEQYTFQNLKPNTYYKFRIREICASGDTSHWTFGWQFTTLPDCQLFPAVTCGTNNAVVVKPGEGNFETNVPGDGREFFFKFKPVLTDEYFAKFEVSDLNELLHFICLDSATTGCDFWGNYHSFSYMDESEGWEPSLGILEAGRTYYFMVDKSDFGTLAVDFSISCATACPAPTQLAAAVLNFQTSKMTWANNGVSEDWELEFRLIAEPFLGSPTHFGSGDSLIFNDLQALRRYHWRVRNICSGGTTSGWSLVSEFSTPPNCANFPVLPCGQTVRAGNFDGFNFLQGCTTPFSPLGEGAEFFYKFTVPFDGDHVLETTLIKHGLASFWYKNAAGGCNFSGWTCIGGMSWAASNFALPKLKAGETYFVGVDFEKFAGNELDTIEFSLRCVESCIVPTGLFVNDLEAKTARIGGNSSVRQLQWEFDLAKKEGSFDGLPDFFSDSASVLATGLEQTTAYKFRMRAQCGAFGTSDWSVAFNFHTPPDCEAFAPLACETETVLHFGGGNGFSTSNQLPNCFQTTPVGQERVLRFTVDDQHPERYFYLPDGHKNWYFFYLRKASAGDCDELNQPTKYVCVNPKSSDSFYEMKNLEPGASYFLLIKNVYAGSASDTLRLRFMCQKPPCVAPSNLQTVINGSDVFHQFDGSKGPWEYEHEIWEEGTSNVQKRTLDWQPEPVSLVGVSPGKIMVWRSRNVCFGNTQQSAWSDVHRFQWLEICAQQHPKLTACSVPTTATLDRADTYRFYSFCAPSAAPKGETKSFLIRLPGAGRYSLRVTAAVGSTFNYNIGELMPSDCFVDKWTICRDVAAGSGMVDIPLGDFTQKQDLALKISKKDDLPGTQTFELVCDCPKPLAASGVINLLGYTDLEWTSPAVFDRYGIEIRPVSENFTGQPNHFATENKWDGQLDTAVSWKFQVRTECTGNKASEWLGPFPIVDLHDCSKFSTMHCGDTLELEMPSGFGTVLSNPCVTFSVGRETYFHVQSELAKRVYWLEMLSQSFSSEKLVFSDVGNCEHPTGTLGCLGSAAVGKKYGLGSLGGNSKMTLMADNREAGFTFFKVAIGCGLKNDEPFDVAGVNQFLGAEVVYVQSDSSQNFAFTFSNEGATTSGLDVNAAAPNGIWKDGSEHSVWFSFSPRASGSVHIEVAALSSSSIDPQVALLVWDSISQPAAWRILATGEDRVGGNPTDAVLDFTGLSPDKTYFLVVDGAAGSTGLFSLKINEAIQFFEPPVGQCLTFEQTPPTAATPDWKNLYAASPPNVAGELIAAIRTAENLGKIAVSVGKFDNVPTLPSGQKLVPRYFNISPEKQPIAPVGLRLFFTADEFLAFLLAFAPDSLNVNWLGITQFDGVSEDCDPTNNPLANLNLVAAPVEFVPLTNGNFYLETVVSGFSEFGATLDPKKVAALSPEQWAELSVFPQPFSDFLKLELSLPRQTDALDLQVFDWSGQRIFGQNLGSTAAGKSIFEINGSAWQSGVFSVLIFENGRLLARSLVLKM